MSELTLVIVRIAFLAVLWLFIFIVIYAVRSDLFGPKLTQLQQAAVNSQRATPPAPSRPDAPTTVTERATAPSSRSSSGAPTRSSSGAPTRIVVTAGPKAGLELDLPETGLTIGRSSGSGLQIRDDYTSNSHAKIMRWRDQWMVQDLDSTNGTFVDGKRVTVPTPVRIGTQVRIGTTTFELRR